ncbi:ParB N-terminal domain-containing protein [Sphingobium baderi]|uniref:ParB-like N-terminal domain-containing protein n=1 Tax=Sphingobium baderi LL03 TaxID=1114964 RepID=T0H282_9SPHN|nr:ParB N-terminal domain-containing protein [Sphingobium baderi]EQB06193.1 hypothetical protein L485_00755 [Sphingobium baderi LL03]KMS62761.1 DNA methylase N-4 [Sphingobium baderi LL03]
MQSQCGPLSRGDLAERDITLLKPHSRNARAHSKKQISQIARSIEKFGFTNPVLIDEQDRIIAGHGRVEAAKSLGLTRVPVLLLEGMSEADRRAYIIADNRLAELAGWDSELLGLELADISALVPDFDFDVIGFDVAEIEALLNGVDEKEVVEDAPEDPEQKASPITRPGDMWQLGGHRLICGDSTKIEVFGKLMGDELAQMVFTDAPYNVPVNGHICGLGKVQHDEFVMGAGEMSREEFADFLAKVMANLAAYSIDGSIHYQCMDWRHMGEMLEAGERVYDSLRNLVVWNKDNGGMGTFYRSKHELIFVFRKGSAAHINNFELGQHGSDTIEVVRDRCGAAIDALSSNSAVQHRRHLLDMVRRIDIGDGRLVITFSLEAIDQQLAGQRELEVGINMVRTGRQTRIVIPPPATQSARPNPSLLKLVAQAFAARAEMDKGGSFLEVAARLGCGREYLADLLRTSYLAPSIIKAILEGRQPPTLSRKQVMQTNRIPLDWLGQESMFGFS